jgi:predicted PurR-regulated permease PerM
VGLLIFGITLFATYVGGPDFLALLREASPLGPNVARRLGLAFRETGRGLFIGIGLTSASQATLATVGYAVAGVNRPLAMGVLTFFATLIPGIGLGLIWIPICTALYLTKHTTAAIGLALFMALIVGSIDNFLRPIFARVGRLDLPATVLILAIVSGFMAFGPWGLLWGPLCVRMGVEGLRIAREMRPARVGQTG